MRTNQALGRLRRGEVVTCFWMNLGSPLLAEMAARWNAFDSILLDAQHGYWTEETLLTALQVIGPTETVPLVRVARNDPALIGRALDAGALGVMVPLVNSVEEAKQAVSAMRYPPAGSRSAGGTRLFYYGEDYYGAANSEILCMVMIETVEAVSRAVEILSVPGVDMGFIGPGDLAISLGCYPQRGSVHEAAVMKVLEAGNKAGKPVGLLSASLEEALRRAQQGFRFIPQLTDYLAFRERVTEYRHALQAGLNR